MAEVEIVKVEEQVGLQEVGENLALAPSGIPATEKLTSWLSPEVKVAVTVVLTELPCPTESVSGLTEREKSKSVTVTLAEQEVDSEPSIQVLVQVKV